MTYAGGSGKQDFDAGSQRNKFTGRLFKAAITKYLAHRKEKKLQKQKSRDIVCVAIYAVLVQNIATEEDIIMAIWSCVGYTVLLCFTLFKTGSLSKAVFNAH